MQRRRLLRFPQGFVWGSATAALQIEGREGRGLSVWDEFCDRFPERIFEAATPRLACDHVRRWADDVAWMQRLRHTGYRFSISWPRVDPHGAGAFSTAGLDFYDRLIDALLEAGIAPNATLYHWDLPLALGKAACAWNRAQSEASDPSALLGWEDPRTVERFAAYARVCFQRLGDRVTLWGTLNEPAWTILNGYVTALHPPALHDYRAAVLASHRLLQAHDAAVRGFRESGRDGAIGICLNISPVLPASDGPGDAQAARLADGLLNRWFLEPVMRGTYPQDVLDFYARRSLLPEGVAEQRIARCDWLGVNYYYPHHASADSTRTEFSINNTGRAHEPCRLSIEGLFRFVRNPRGRYTDWAWEIDPDALELVLREVHAICPDMPLYITENGLGLDDAWVDGEIDDAPRIAFVRDHLAAVHRAIEAGVDVRGYYMWSLLDNFSWINGYKKRYGFLHVDRETLARTPKRSAHWFAEVSESNAVAVDVS